jgi:hypothetical protein
LIEERAEDLRFRLRGLGLTDGAIAAAWPRWWSSDADKSASARAELRFSIARRLGLDPRSLLEDRGEPRFVWKEEARFKHLRGESDVERSGITSFGRSVASALVNATPASSEGVIDASATSVREQILRRGQPYVGLLDLLAVSWAFGIPVIHLRIFPWPQKRMAAMTVRVGERWAILLGKDSNYPAPLAFYLAHELGHIILGHIGADRQIVDLEEQGLSLGSDDSEEGPADAFALEVLTGDPRPVVLPAEPGTASGRELARVAVESAVELGIEPGMLAQCFGYSTGDWPTATAALNYIYETRGPVWRVVNDLAIRQLNLEEVPSETQDFLKAVLGDLVE